MRTSHFFVRFLVLASSVALTLPVIARAQWVPQHPATEASFRGMSVVNDRVVWISGSHGTYLWTTNGGAKWHVGTVPDAGQLDFRAVHAVSLDTAYLMAAAQDSARIYYTTNRGRNWTLQYESAVKGIFLDAMAFLDRTHALVLSDPIDGHFRLLRTDDAGKHWTPVPTDAIPAALPNEAAFAASGTALINIGSRHAWFATGGNRARVFRTNDGGATWHVSDTPVLADVNSRGIFSLAFTDTLHGVAVGGDYAQPDSTSIAAAYTDDGGVTWTAIRPSKATSYLSGVTYLPRTNGRSLIAVGTVGTAYSTDRGRTWRVLDTRSFNVVTAAPNGRVWTAGDKGAVATRSALKHGITPVKKP